jgi:hypothetical protein
MSFWSGGYQNGISPHLINMHKLAAYTAIQHYGNCTLITDKKAFKILKQIKFTNIRTDLDCLNGIINKNWALGKLYTYNIASNIGNPFLHIDYDVVLVNKIGDEYLNSEVLVQSEEPDKPYYWYGLENFDSLIKNRYDMVDKPHENDVSYNMGIFGGTDLKFINYYSEQAIKFSTDPENQIFFNDTYSKKPWGPACISEQYYLGACARSKNVKVKCYLDGSPKEYIHYHGDKTSRKVVKDINHRLKKLLRRNFL